MPKKVPTLHEVQPLASADFLAFEPHKRRDPDYNPERLRLRRKLQRIGEALGGRLAAAGERLVVRTSLHHPFVHNRFHVGSLSVALSPPPALKRRLTRLLGVEFREETEAGFAHTNFVLEVDREGATAGLRVHEKAWWDAQNLRNRIADREGLEALRSLLDALPRHYALSLDRKGREWRPGEVRWDDLLAFFRALEPGVRRIWVARRVAAEDPFATSRAFLEEVAEEFVALLPLYRFITWSPENDHLRLGGAT